MQAGLTLMVSLFLLPDQEVLSASSGMVYLCEPLSALDGLVVIPVKSILLVVSMFPDMQVKGNGRISEMRKFYSLSCNKLFFNSQIFPTVNWLRMRL
jgi:hypothetical protein